jgi:penicillin-binding protein 1C
MHPAKFKKRKALKYTACLAAALFLVWFLFFSLPKTLFDTSYSKVLYSQEGELLNAQVAADHQWRFPADHEPGSKFEQCILTFEDRGFYHHHGVSSQGFSRAVVENCERWQHHYNANSSVDAT